jgi:hypothetical protein
MSGKYLEDNAISLSSDLSCSKTDQERLWNISWNLLSKWMDGKSIDEI